MPVDLPQATTVHHSLGSSIAHLRAKWIWFAVLGAGFVLAGFIAFGSLLTATVATVVVNGVMMLIAGAAEFSVGLRMKTWGRLVLLCAAGALLLATGILCIFNPLLASVALTLCVGVGLCAAGVVRIYVASQMGEHSPWIMAIVSGLVTFFLGVVILAHWPTNSLYVLGLFLAVDLIFYGVALLGLGFQLRRHHFAH